jgi:hypothetical protein
MLYVFYPICVYLFERRKDASNRLFKVSPLSRIGIILIVEMVGLNFHSILLHYTNDIARTSKEKNVKFEQII